jgi:signal transduction histidine kinase
MTARLRNISLRGRLALALAGVAVLAVALATGLTDSGLSSRLESSARARLDAAAAHTAQLARALYSERGASWAPQTLTELTHAAAVAGYTMSLYDSGGHRLTGPALPGGTPRSRAPVNALARTVGAVVLTPQEGQVLTAADRQLRTHLNTLHLIAALVALTGGLLAAVLLSGQLARPLQALTAAARRIERGDLAARVKPAGAPETASLGRAFNRLAQTLSREEQIRRAAAADVAHELRTPLAGIVSRVEAAQDGLMADEPANLAAIHDEALRLSQLAADLGKLSEAEQPGLTLTKRDVDLASLARERLAIWSEQADQKGIGLHDELQPAHVQGDPRRLAQVLDNLLSNALRYTDAGGQVTVTVSGADSEARLAVSDTGIGIAGEELPNVFQRFWRGEPSRARRTGGAGIGLAIAQELVRAHDGRIDVRSRPREGSTFTVTLPATDGG